MNYRLLTKKPAVVDLHQLTTVVTPGTSPVTLAEAKRHLRIADTVPSDADLDAEIQASLDAAVQAVETDTQRTVTINQRYAMTLDRLTGPLYLPYPPALSLVSITYYDGDNAQQTLSDGELVFARIGKSALRFNDGLPSTYDRIDAVTITWDAGYTSTIPADLRLAIMYQLDLAFDNDLEEKEAMAIQDAYERKISGYEPGTYR